MSDAEKFLKRMFEARGAGLVDVKFFLSQEKEQTILDVAKEIGELLDAAENAKVVTRFPEGDKDQRPAKKK